MVYKEDRKKVNRNIPPSDTYVRLTERNFKRATTNILIDLK